MANSSFLLDDWEEICDPMGVSVIMAGGYSVNETRTAYSYLFLSKLTWPWCFGDNVSENKRFTLDKHIKLKSEPFGPIN